MPSEDFDWLRFNASESSISTNATEPNLPGAGRTLGLLFDSLGRALEQKGSGIAEKWGFGPRAVAVRIQKIRPRPISYYCFDHQQYCLKGHCVTYPRNVSAAEKKKLKKDCRRLVKYATRYCSYFFDSSFKTMMGERSNVPGNQLIALDTLCDIAFADQKVRKILAEVDAVKALARRISSWPEHHPEMLLNKSRRALASVSENIINCAGQQLLPGTKSPSSIYSAVPTLIPYLK